jgi:hypothetical protein
MSFCLLKQRKTEPGGLSGSSGKEITAGRTEVMDSINFNDKTAECFRTLNLILQEV